MTTSQKQAARKFVEYWTFQRGSEKGEDQQFWNSLLRDVLGITDVEQHIKYQVPVQLKNTTKFLDAWIPETRVLIEHKSRGVNLDAPQTSALTYDADGNMTNDGTFVYAYDAENRLVSVTSAMETNGAIRVLNTYDHRNRRIRKTVQRLNSTIAPPPSPPVGVHEWETQETHTFVWDGNNIVFEKVEFANGTIRTFEYFWGADKSGSEQGAGGVEGLLAVSVDGVFYIPCYDHNGNIILYISETGSIAAQYTYDPYGNVIDTYGNLADVFSFGFSTQYHDRETGMVGYQQRFYSPVLGRWLNRDPIGEKGGLSLYAMCQNNAIAKYDILGLSWTINRDSSKRWATARRSSSKDTFEELAQKLKLETSESSKWLKPKGNDTCTFDIPNVFCVYTSKSGWWDGVITFVTHLKRVAMADSERYKAAGFMVIAHEWAISEDAFYSMWTQDGIYAISFAGHGSKYGFIADKDSDSAIGPDAVRPPYKLSAIRAYSCLSSVDIQGNIILPDGTTPSHSWRELVSSTGTFFGYSGSVNWISQFWQEVSINEESN